MSITLSTIDKLIQMGKELGYEGQALQEFVKQQQDIERSERLAERELEKERIAAEKDKIAADREIEMARIESMEEGLKRIGKLNWLRLKVIRRLN